jgi:hypothetical protein
VTARAIWQTGNHEGAKSRHPRVRPAGRWTCHLFAFSPISISMAYPHVAIGAAPVTSGESDGSVSQTKGSAEGISLSIK